MAVLCVTGCSRLSDRYGVSDGKIGRESLNGFGALRRSFEQAGCRTRKVTLLSKRVADSKTIVWTPRVPGAIPADVTKWFERWLRRGDRTLVFILPDGGSAADYYLDAAKLAPPDQRLEYRRRAAREQNDQVAWRLNRLPPSSNGWFVIKPIEYRANVTSLRNDWSHPDVQPPELGIEFELEFQDRQNTEDHNAELAAATTPAPAGPTGPGAGGAAPGTGVGFWMPTPEVEVTNEELTFRKLIAGDALVPAPIEDAPNSKTNSVSGTATGSGAATPGQSGGASGKPDRVNVEAVLAAKVTSKNWRSSQIIVVNGGSLLTNYAFTREWNRRFADDLVRSASTSEDEDMLAGFLTSDSMSIPIREGNSGVPKATGMEMLTVWPISLITIHGVLLGLIICLMLLPIFGRPRKIQRVTEGDFGDHLDAVAALMLKTNGEDYARNRISEYMRRVRGETQGPWIAPESKTTGKNKPVPQSTDQHPSVVENPK